MHRISRHNITSFYSSRMGVHFFFCFTLRSQLSDDASNLSAWHPGSSNPLCGVAKQPAAVPSGTAGGLAASACASGLALCREDL